MPSAPQPGPGSPSDQPLERLFSSYLADELPEEDFALLESGLLQDEQLRRNFIEYLNVDSALGELGAFQEAELDELELATTGDELALPLQSPPGSVRSRWAPMLLLAATAAGLVIAATIWTRSNRSDSRVPVAEMVSAFDIQVNRDQLPWHQSGFAAGRYQLTRGLLHLGFSGGVNVYLEAPTDFELVDAQNMTLHQGRLSAKVPPAGIGFTVRTSEAEVIDLGTEFSVEAESGKSEVHVFEGLVEVHPLGASEREVKAKLSLRSEDAIRIDEKLSEPVDIQLARDRFIRSFDEPRWKYPMALKALDPIAYYRMRIAGPQLVCQPAKYSGVVLTGRGLRPAHAPGFIGASLRVSGDSIGRGAVAENPPPLTNGSLTLIASIYLNESSAAGTALSNLSKTEGNLSLDLDEAGRLRGRVRSEDGTIVSLSGDPPLKPFVWYQVALVADGHSLALHLDGREIASTPCRAIAPVKARPIWFGASPEGDSLWNGRLDEVAVFDRALTADQIPAASKIIRPQDSLPE